MKARFSQSILALYRGVLIHLFAVYLYPVLEDPEEGSGADSAGCCWIGIRCMLCQTYITVKSAVFMIRASLS